ncbi:hypothetical protein SDC9_149219 [bioreactor metagenome]|uniref:Uncharacterized protein n=1 Tax=bioreactor metagenome TaxID=1076179 RepID=A0A645EKL5_9ZZZZ
MRHIVTFDHNGIAANGIKITARDKSIFNINAKMQRRVGNIFESTIFETDIVRIGNINSGIDVNFGLWKLHAVFGKHRTGCRDRFVPFVIGKSNIFKSDTAYTVYGYQPLICAGIKHGIMDIVRTFRDIVKLACLSVQIPFVRRIQCLKNIFKEIFIT